MSRYTLTVDVSMETLRCSECDVLFGVTEAFYGHRHRDRNTFYCPNGHSQWFPGKTAEQLAKEAERNAALAEARAAELEKKLARVKRRADAGVCQHCKRHFMNVQRHVERKHK